MVPGAPGDGQESADPPKNSWYVSVPENATPIRLMARITCNARFIDMSRSWFAFQDRCAHVSCLSGDHANGVSERLTSNRGSGCWCFPDASERISRLTHEGPRCTINVDACGGAAVNRLYENRMEAGRRLAALLSQYEGRPGLIVLRLPRGGVPVAYEVARALGAPLDVFTARKLGVPGHEELAMGAIATGGACVLNDDV